MQCINGGAIDVRAPKYGSERVVYLADSLVTVLAEHVAAHGTTGKGRWLFAGEGDDPPHQNTVGYWWRKTLRDAGLTGIKLHDLRHFYASGLIAAGCDVVTVQRSLGHAKATTTLNTYAHLWPTAEDRTRKAAESIMSASLGERRPWPRWGRVRPSDVASDRRRTFQDVSRWCITQRPLWGGRLSAQTGLGGVRHLPDQGLMHSGPGGACNRPKPKRHVHRPTCSLEPPSTEFEFA